MHLVPMLSYFLSSQVAVAAGYRVELYLVEMDGKKIIKMISYCADHRPPDDSGVLRCDRGGVAGVCWIYSTQIASYHAWECQCIFKIPHSKQSRLLCWLYTLTDVVESVYHLLHPEEARISISKQFILDYIDTDDKKDFNEPFGWCFWKSLLWAADTFLVQEGDYHLFSGVKEIRRTRNPGPLVHIRDLMRHEGNEQTKIEEAILKQPVGASITLKSDIKKLLKEDPMRAYALSNDGTKEQHHALVLSGEVSYCKSSDQDSYLAKDPLWLGREGRICIKKMSAIVGEEKIQLIMWHIQKL